MADRLGQMGIFDEIYKNIPHFCKYKVHLTQSESLGYFKMILILTHRHGFEADRIIDLLRNRRLSYFRLNTDFESDNTRFHLCISSDQSYLLVNCDRRTLNLKDVRCAWFQQPMPEPSEGSSVQLLRFRSKLIALQAVIENIDCPWINHPNLAYRAANKWIQLDIAKKNGLLIPPTVVSNDPEQLRDFLEQEPNLVAKSLGVQWYNEGSNWHAAYTQKVEKKWVNQTEDILFAPVIYQKFIPRVHDYRVVVVGKTHFSVVCESPLVAQIYDCRKGESKYCPVELDVSVIESLKRMLSNLSLDYCSADFFEGEDGKIYFCDLNVSGSWWWVDNLYCGKISEALVELLEKKSRAGHDGE